MKRGVLYSFGRLIFIPVLKLLFAYRVKGRENLPKEGAYIICSNHLSNYDPMLLAVTQSRQIFYMAKAELFKNRFFGAILKKLGAFPVQRGAGDGKAINEAENIVQNGNLLGIFIEGTRSKTGEFLRPKSGAAIIAHQMNIPVIPVCITPYTKTKRVKAFHKVTVSWGKPIMPEELGFTEGGNAEYRNASRIIMSEIKKLREEEQQ